MYILLLFIDIVVKFISITWCYFKIKQNILQESRKTKQVEKINTVIQEDRVRIISKQAVPNEQAKISGLNLAITQLLERKQLCLQLFAK